MTHSNKTQSPTADYDKFLSEAVDKHGAQIQTLAQIANVWTGETYKPEENITGEAFEQESAANDMFELRVLNHLEKSKEEITTYNLKAELTTEAAIATKQEELLRPNDILILTKEELGKVARFDDLLLRLLSPKIGECTVASDKHAVIRLRPEFKEAFGKNGLYSILASALYQNYLRAISGGNKMPQLSIQQIEGIRIPLFPRDKALLLNILLSVEPQANLDRILKALDHPQACRQALLFISETPGSLEFSKLAHNLPITEVRVSLLKLAKGHGTAFVNANHDSRDPFVDWLKQFVIAANHLEEILEVPRGAKQILTLQAWRSAISDHGQPLRLAWERYQQEIKEDLAETKDEAIALCSSLFDGMVTLSLRCEKEAPFHPTSFEDATKRADHSRQLSALLNYSRRLNLHGAELCIIPFFLRLAGEPEFCDALNQQNRSAFDSALSSFSLQSEIHRCAVRWFESLLPRLQERELWDVLSHTRACVVDLGDSSSRELSREFLEQISLRNSKLTGETSLPKELMSLMVRAVRISPASCVYIPYIPGFEFSDLLPESAECCFQFRSYNEAGIFALHELIMDRQPAFRVSDPVTEWNPFGEKINSVIAAPPFGQRIANHSEFRDTDVQCIIESARLVKGEGKAVICVAPSFLFRGGRLSEDRRNLIQQNIIDTVICLPPGLLESSGIRTVLLILRPPSSEPKPVVLVDASECFKKLKTSRRSTLDLEMLQSILEAVEHPSKRSVSHVVLEDNDYDLSPGRYLLKELKEIPENHSVYPLRDLIKSLTHYPRCQAGDTGVQISQRLFPASDNIEPVSFDDLETIAYDGVGSQAGWRRVNGNALILNSILMKDGLRACLFEHKGRDLFLRPDALTFEVNSEIVDPQWLLLSLGSEFVKSQLQTLTVGVGIPRIRTELLLDLKLAVPNQRDQQRTLVTYHKESLLRSRAKELGLEEHIQAIKKEFLNDLRLKKHSISQIVNSMDCAIAVLIDELEKKGSISAGQIINRRRSINFDEYLRGVAQKCAKLGEMIELLTEEKRFEPLAPLDLKKAMEKLERECQAEDFNLTFSLDEHSFVDQTTGDAVQPIIRIGENDFQDLCRNIIDNAKRHGGFQASYDSAHVQVDILLIGDSQTIELVFKNNGAPFPIDMTLERFIIRGEKAGTGANTGTGGYHIKSIMDHAGGSLNIATSISDDYPVEIKLQFPLSHDESL